MSMPKTFKDWYQSIEHLTYSRTEYECMLLAWLEAFKRGREAMKEEMEYLGSQTPVEELVELLFKKKHQYDPVDETRVALQEVIDELLTKAQK